MHIGKVLRSGRTVTIEMPEGFEVDGSEVEVHRDGTAILLRPVRTETAAPDDWAWLDRFEHKHDAELMGDIDAMNRAIDDMDAADRLRDKAARAS